VESVSTEFNGSNFTKFWVKHAGIQTDGFELP